MDQRAPLIPTPVFVCMLKTNIFKGRNGFANELTVLKEFIAWDDKCMNKNMYGQVFMKCKCSTLKVGSLCTLLTA